MKEKYNRNKEKKIIEDLITKPSEKIIFYQVAFYDNDHSVEMQCFDESFYPPEEEKLAKSYLSYGRSDDVRVFAIYEDGFKEEL